MKVAFFTDCFLDLTGGIVTSIAADKAELERRGHLVYVFSSAYPRTENERRELAARHIFPVPSCRVLGRGICPVARRPRIIERWLERNFPELAQFDVFYVHYEAGCSIAGLRLAKRLGVPSIQFMHGREDSGEEKLIAPGFRTIVAASLNWCHSWYLPHPLKVEKDNYLARTLARAKMWTLMVNHANYADLVLVPSNHFRAKLINYGVEREIIALPHGLCRQKTARPVVKSLSDGETLEILWHSRVSGEKRILPFLRALSGIKTGYHLTVFGEGPDLPAARLYAINHRMKVSFRGNVRQSTIARHLENAHLDVLVSYDYDTFGMVIAEARASAVPMFLVDPDLRETLPNGSYVLADGPSVKAMRRAIRQLLAHPERIAKMSEAMSAEASAYGISDKIDQLEKIIHRLGARS